MLKGVNKSIVEINDTGNMYFERVVLYIRPEMNNVPERHIAREAAEYINSNVPDRISASSRKKGRTLYLFLIHFSVAAAALIALAAVWSICR